MTVHHRGTVVKRERSQSTPHYDYVRDQEKRRDQLYRALYGEARAMPEWSQFLTGAQAERSAGR